MSLSVKDLIEKEYIGYSVRSIVTDKKFRKTVINDKRVRGNREIKKVVLDKIAVGGKVLLTGPTGEAKTLFARLLIDYIAQEISSHKYHIAGCPFLEDAGYLVHIIENFSKNIFNSIDVLQSLCPYCRKNIEDALSTKTEKISLDNSSEIVKMAKTLPSKLEKVAVEKTLVRRTQIDPRNDPESLYILLAGVENLEKLLGGDSTETFSHQSHKVGTLSQGFMVVNEIQRLHLSLLESLMGFLEDPQGIKYNLSGETVFVDGAIIFTSNAPLTVFGEESQPIINRVPEVLWPARDVTDRIEIVRDMFQDHMVTSKLNITPNPTLIRMFELSGTNDKDLVSRLAYEFLAHVANESIPRSLKSSSARSENRVARTDFYSALDEIHNPQRSPHIDLRTLNNAIGEIVIGSEASEEFEGIIVSLDTVRKALELYDISPTMINNGLQAIKLQLRNTIREGKTAVSVDDVTEEMDKLKSLSDEDLKKIVYEFEHLAEKEAKVGEYIFEKLKPSYQALLQVSYM
ncbi:MAG: hypothetical protein HeimC2_27390 [Candidatus Heimdallarchaeota archaeon LC_2]|nr:MAG: hypothetical protein HeimC2_27390 [Candidatus Heimdallarchaeota archaeon LC_2]